MTAKLELSTSKRRLLQRMLAGQAPRQPLETPAVTSRAAGTPVYLSAEQNLVWWHAAMAPDVPLYNEPITIHYQGLLDVAALEASFNELIRRHEIWRTSFREVGGEIAQIVHDKLCVRFPLIDLSNLPREAREAEALRIATLDARRPFDLARAPLFRACITKLSAHDFRLYLTLHHLIFDGVSLYRIVMPELAALYKSLIGGGRPPPPPPRLQYGDYTVWRQALLENGDGGRLQSQIAYWRRALAEVGHRAPRSRRPLQSYHASVEPFALSSELSAALQEFSRNEGVTLYATLLAAFKILLFHDGDEEDIVVGGVVDMRRRPELERVMGYFLNTLPLRTKISGSFSFRDYLRIVQRAVVDALCASDVPFDRLLREALPRRDLDRQSLFSAVFSIEPRAEPFAAGWDLTQIDVSNGTAKFDLCLELDERPDRLIGRMVGNAELFSPPTIHALVSQWIGLLEAVMADPDRRVGELDGRTTSRPPRRATSALVTAGAVRAQPLPQAAVLEPRDELQSRLARIWRQVLGVSQVSRDDDFFDLGGHSLLLTKLLHRIEVEFGRRLPATALFRAATIEGMAALLEKPAGAGSAGLGGMVFTDRSHPPLLWLRAGPAFRALAQALGPDLPFLSLDLELAELPASAILPRLSEIAARLVHTVRAIQPSGPYFLGGWCAAGILAYEVASQLQEAGARVDLLVLIHAPNPTSLREIGTLELELSRLKHHAFQVFRGKGRESWGYAVQRVNRGWQALSRRRSGLAGSSPSLDTGEIIDRVVLTYEPKPYAGDVVLFQPIERPDVLDYRPGWEGVISGKFACYEIPGDHHTMLSAPHVGRLSAAMSACLRQAQAANGVKPSLSRAR